MEELSKYIAKVILTEVRERKINNHKIGHYINLHHSHVSRLLRNERRFSVDQLDVLSKKVLKTDLKNIIAKAQKLRREEEKQKS